MLPLLLFLSPVWSLPANTSQPPCQCGRSPSESLALRVYGGEEAVPNEFPWAALVIIKNQSEQHHVRCGASLLTDRHLLTAAHCMEPGNIRVVLGKSQHLETPPPVGAFPFSVLGEHRISTADGTELMLRVVNYLVHPKYKQSGFGYDFALLRLEKSVDFSSHPNIR